MDTKIKVWHTTTPDKIGAYICRMDNAAIKMCHFDGEKWIDMWQDSLIGSVKKWMLIPDEDETIQITTADAVRKLVSSLKEDNGFYESWKANIAMSFIDNNRWAMGKGGIRKIANDSADYFLKLLMKD